MVLVGIHKPGFQKNKAATGNLFVAVIWSYYWIRVIDIVLTSQLQLCNYSSDSELILKHMNNSDLYELISP